MKDEIKEILEDNDELMVRYKDNSFECFDTLPKNVLDYITNLQEENNQLTNARYSLDRVELEKRIDKALDFTNRTIEVIKQQPSGNDEWILGRLNGINYCLGGDEE